MTKDEFKIIAKSLRSAYRQNDFLNTGEALDMWYRMLEDLEYKYAIKATENHIKSSVYPPSISDIRHSYEEIKSNEGTYRQQLRDIYDFTKGVYPSSEDTKTARVTWGSIVNKGKTWTEKIAIASAIRTATVHFVEDAERSGQVDNIPNFENYLKGMAHES